MRFYYLILFLLCFHASCQDRHIATDDKPMGSFMTHAISQDLLETQHKSVRICAEGNTVFGIDVSRWQTDIDWNQVANDGVKYAIIRATNGTEIIDQYFGTNWLEAKRAGIFVGAYQYFRPNQDAIAQADLLIQRIREEGGDMDLPPVIDVETDDDQPASVIRQKVRAWIDRVEAELNVKPIIYTGFYFWRDVVGGTDEFAEYPLWHPQYTSAECPNISDAWSTWYFWQYTSEGRVNGIEGNVDLNRFNGSFEDLQRWVNETRVDIGDRDRGVQAREIWGGRPRGQTFPLASEPAIELCDGEEVAGELLVENIGNVAWDEGVILAPTPRDQVSSLAHPMWRSPIRVTAVSNPPIAVGQEGTFQFSITASPERLGEYSQTFGLLKEGVTWFADQGGPDDEYIELKVNVRACPTQVVGEVDRISCDGIKGWVWDPGVSQRWLSVELMTQIAGQVDRKRMRADLEDENCSEEGPCTHGFYFDLPESLSTQNDIQVNVIAYDVHGDAYPLAQEMLACAGNKAGEEAGGEAGADAGVEAGGGSGAGAGVETGEGVGGEAGADAGVETVEGAGGEAGADASTQSGVDMSGVEVDTAGDEAGSDSSTTNRNTSQSNDEGCQQSNHLSHHTYVILLLLAVYYRKKPTYV